MPRGGKTNKKKARNRIHTQVKAPERANNAKPPTSFSAPGPARQPPAEVAPPEFQAFQQSGKVLPDNYRTVYSRYKAATKRVFDYLQGYARDNFAPAQDDHLTLNVDSLVFAVDSMAEARILVDPDILKDLKFAIRMRTKVARSVYGGGDSGHKYLLDTLVYCWKVLDSLPRLEKKKEELDKHEGEGYSKNYFEALQETGDLEEDDDMSILDEEIFSSQDVPRATLDGESIPLQELLDSEDRTDAIFFLLTLNEFMRCVVEQHACLVKWAGYIAEAEGHESAIIPPLLEATIATNMAIQQVQRLEIEFELQNPHINTPYRLLSYIKFPVLVQDVLKIAREHGKKVCSAREANLFLGDCLECSFRDRADPENKISWIVSDFCSRFEIDSEGSEAIDEIFLNLRFITAAEVPLKHEIEGIGFTSPSHEWLGGDYIGGDRAIHHTLRLLQLFGVPAKNLPGGQFPTIYKGFFGSSPWKPGTSNKIHNDLDELLMTEVLPSWFYMCRDWMLKDGTSPSLPHQSELAPFWSCIRRFVRSPEKPVKWSSVFAVHAMLAGILETDKIANELAAVCLASFDCYFRQLDFAYEYKKQMDGSFNSEIFEPGMSILRYFEQLGHPFFGPRALWNPLCAGTSLLYLNYQGNIQYGAALINDRSQLKIVMHLYHALRVTDILKQGDIPFLDWLYKGFERSKALWGGLLPPAKGKFAESFWLSLRGKLKICQKIMAKISRLDGTILSDEEHLEMIEVLCKSQAQVDSGMLNPAGFSTSFRRICNRDYHDVVDICHLKELQNEGSGDDLYEFAVQLNDTIEAYTKEHNLFSYNLPACGVYLDEFVSGMSHFFGWDRIFKGALRVQNTRLEHPERIAEEYMFASYVLGTLDQAKDPAELGRIRGFVTFFMCPFFNKLYAEGSCIWFAGIDTSE